MQIADLCDMKKSIRLLVLLTFIIISYFVIQRSQYEKFYPVIFSVEYDGLVIDDMNMPDNFYGNLEKVLKYYKEDYQKRGDVIYVKKTLYKDLDLCWNYTSKANNKVWLHSRE